MNLPYRFINPFSEFFKILFMGSRNKQRIIYT